MITIKTPFVEITLKPDEDLMQELHREEIEAYAAHREVDEVITVAGLIPRKSFNQKPEPMKKYQLLEKAMRDYPAGTLYHSVLRPTESHISTGSFYIDGADSVAETPSGYCIYQASSGKWAEIIPAKSSNYFVCDKCKNETPIDQDNHGGSCFTCANKRNSILTEKCAIQVNNEREFKLLMVHFDSKGWKSLENRNPDSVKYVQASWCYKNYFGWASDGFRKSEGVQIIQFADFAKEVGITVPVFVMKSEDGVDLYEGDDFYSATRAGSSSRWYLNAHDEDVNTNCFCFSAKYKNSMCYSVPSHNKAFSTKGAAEKWIAEQNKPKHKVMELFTGMEAWVYGGEILIKDADKTVATLYPSEIDDISAVLKSLQP